VPSAGLTDRSRLGKSPMLGFAEEEAPGYGLLSDDVHRSKQAALARARTACATILLLGAVGALAWTAAEPPPVITLAAVGEIGAAEEACATKPFGQCSGMNFSEPKDKRNAFNFTAGAPEFTCCPEGTHCITFGPVWGLCMPSFLKPKEPATVVELTVADDEAASPSDALESSHEDAHAGKEKDKSNSKEEEEEEPNACGTKAFGQCAGVEFAPGAALVDDDKEDAMKKALGGLNFSAPAKQFACCPEGTKCIIFGPVWGMCMPSFGPGLG